MDKNIYMYDYKRTFIFNSSRVIEVQEKCTERAIELLALPDDTPALLLDLGCGSGLSGETITEQGHLWVGLDISEAMLGEYSYGIHKSQKKEIFQNCP